MEAGFRLEKSPFPNAMGEKSAQRIFSQQRQSDLPADRDAAEHRAVPANDEAIYADECLMFCSDFPHWDFDSPLLTFPKLDDALWERIFYQNAADLYELPARRSDQGGAEG